MVVGVEYMDLLNILWVVDLLNIRHVVMDLLNILWVMDLLNIQNIRHVVKVLLKLG